MEYQKIIKLFDNITNQLSTFLKKNWSKINDSPGTFNTNSQIKISNSMLVKGTASIANMGGTSAATNNGDKK